MRGTRAVVDRGLVEAPESPVERARDPACRHASTCASRESSGVGAERDQPVRSPHFPERCSSRWLPAKPEPPVTRTVGTVLVTCLHLPVGRFAPRRGVAATSGPGAHETAERPKEIGERAEACEHDGDVESTIGRDRESSS